VALERGGEGRDERGEEGSLGWNQTLRKIR